MKLIHCADLHLDSPMEANLTAEKARERERELRETFLRLVRYADGEGVRAILIAGDLFDSPTPRESTRRFFLDTVGAYPRILFFYLAGNHDRGVRFSREECPKNLFCFGNAWRTYDLGEVTVTGSEDPDEETLRLDPLRCNFLLLHGQERAGAGARERDVIRMGLLRSRGVDYLALGHLHSYRAAPLDARGTAVYSGCLEGRGFDECGERGFVLLETAGRQLRHSFHSFAKRRLYTVDVDVTGADTHLSLVRRAEAALSGIEDTALVKLVLTGGREREQWIDTEMLRQALSERFYFVKVRDESRLSLRAEDFEDDVSLRGAFVRSVLSSSLSERERERVIACGLCALSGEEVGE